MDTVPEGTGKAAVPRPTIQRQFLYVMLSMLYVDEANSCRDEDATSEERLKPLAEDIIINDILTPLDAVQQADGRFLVTNGHTRYAALWRNVRLGVTGFTPARLVPVMVCGPDTRLIDALKQAFAQNSLQQTFSPEEKLEAVLILTQKGATTAEIVSSLKVTDTTVARYQILASEAWLRDLVRRHAITGTNAAALGKLAKAKGRLPELRQYLETWASDMERSIAADEQERKAKDEKPLSIAQKWPQKYMSAELIKHWRTALETGGSMTQPEFRFKATITEKGNIEIDGLRQNISDLSAEEAKKISVRCIELASALAPIIRQKAAAEKVARNAIDNLMSETPNAAVLRMLGIDDLLDDSDVETESDLDELTAESVTDKAVEASAIAEVAPVVAQAAEVTALGESGAEKVGAAADQPAADSLPVPVCDTTTEVLTLQVAPDTGVQQSVPAETAVAEVAMAEASVVEAADAKAASATV